MGSIQKEADALGIKFSHKVEDGAFIAQLSLTCILSPPAAAPPELALKCLNDDVSQFAWIVLDDSLTITMCTASMLERATGERPVVIQSPPEVNAFLETVVSHTRFNYASHQHSTIFLMDEQVEALDSDGNQCAVSGSSLRDQLYQDDRATRLLEEKKLILVALSGSEVNDDRPLCSIMKSNPKQAIHDAAAAASQWMRQLI